MQAHKNRIKKKKNTITTFPSFPRWELFSNLFYKVVGNSLHSASLVA